MYQAYEQLLVTGTTAEVLTTNAPTGSSSVCWLPFGITAATAFKQRMIAATLAGIPGKRVHLGDVMIIGATRQEAARESVAALGNRRVGTLEEVSVRAA